MGGWGVEEMRLDDSKQGYHNAHINAYASKDWCLTA